MKTVELKLPNFGSLSEQQFLLSAPSTVDTVRELPIIEFVASLMDKNREQGILIDAGSHVGFYAIPLSGLFDRVIAFEPSRIQRALLQENILNNKITNVIVKDCALGESEDTMSLKVTGNSGGSNTLGIPTNGLPPMDIYEVDVYSLDYFNLKDVDFIKIDVEGWELQVLNGSIHTLLTSKPQVLIEVWNDDAQRGLIKEYFDKVSYTFDFIFPEFPELAYCKPKKY